MRDYNNQPPGGRGKLRALLEGLKEDQDKLDNHPMDQCHSQLLSTKLHHPSLQSHQAGGELNCSQSKCPSRYSS